MLTIFLGTCIFGTFSVICCCLVHPTPEERRLNDEEFMKWAREQTDRKPYN